MNYVGFWRDEGVFDPWDNKNKIPTEVPVENSATENQEEIIKLLEKHEQFCQENMDAHVTFYFGCSYCRICRSPNGGEEFHIDGFTWPSGYVHYLKKHNVQIDATFKEYLLKRENFRLL